MAFDDTFRERFIIDSDETYEICRIRKRAEILDLVGLGDAIAEWRDRLADDGVTIVPRQVYLVQLYEQYEHRVAWVYRSETHDDYVEDYHHIVCDCVASMDDPDQEIEDIAQCPAVLGALEHRAHRVAEVLRLRSVLGFYGKPENEVEAKNRSIITIKSMVNFILNYDKAHPEGWVANTVSGEHQIPLLATILQIRPYEDSDDEEKISLQGIIKGMETDGSLILHEDGTTVSLPLVA